MPKKTGTNGLTRPVFGKPATFDFTTTESIYLYYITVPSLSDSSFGDLFGNGTKTILVLKRKPGSKSTQKTPTTKRSSSPSVSRPQPTSIANALKVPVVKKPVCLIEKVRMPVCKSKAHSKVSRRTSTQSWRKQFSCLCSSKNLLSAFSKNTHQRPLRDGPLARISKAKQTQRKIKSKPILFPSQLNDCRPTRSKSRTTKSIDAQCATQSKRPLLRPRKPRFR